MGKAPPAKPARESFGHGKRFPLTPGHRGARDFGDTTSKHLASSRAVNTNKLQRVLKPQHNAFSSVSMATHISERLAKRSSVAFSCPEFPRPRWFSDFHFATKSTGKTRDFLFSPTQRLEKHRVIQRACFCPDFGAPTVRGSNSQRL